MTDDPKDLNAKITRALDAEVAQLDAATRDRLRQARRRALAAEVPRQRAGWWLPAGAVAASALALVLWWGRTPVPDAPPIAPTDFELLTTQEPLELYRDLDFYLWLEREAGHAG